MNGETLTILRHVPPLDPRWLLLALAALIAIAWWFYFTETPRRFGAVLRTLVYCGLAAAWGGWSLWTRPAEKPEFAVAVDVSRSQRRAGDTSGPGAAAEALAANESAFAELAGRFRLRYYSMGDGARSFDPTAGAIANADDKVSALGDALVGLADQQRGRPTAGVLMISDGEVNAGAALAAAAEELRRRNLPLYVAGSGAVSRPSDVALADVRVDDQAFVNDLLQFEITLRVSGITAPVVVRLSEGDTALAESQIVPDPQRETVLLHLQHRPREAGERRYRIEATTSQAEIDLENNRAERVVRVAPADFQVLLVAGQPSYEFRRLKTMLEREFAATAGGPVLKTVLQDADPEYADFDRTALAAFPLSREELFKYDVILLDDPQPQAIGAVGFAHLRDFVVEKGGGLAIIAGPRFGAEFRQAMPKELLPADFSQAIAAEASDEEGKFTLTPLGRAAPPLLLADQPAESERVWSRMPPFLFRAAVPAVRPGVRVLAEFQSPGRPPSPALTLQFSGAGRVLFQASDESYRFAYRAGDVYFGRYWQQWIRYLARGKLRGGEATLTVDRSHARAGEPVRLSVRFPENQRANAGEDVRIRLERADGFARTATATEDTFRRGEYSAEVADLPPGQYVARLEAPAVSAHFEVLELAPESPGAVVRAKELRQAAEVTGGRYRPASELADLLAEIPPAELAPTGAGAERPLWNSPFVAAILLALLCGEWVWRKRVGLF